MNAVPRRASVLHCAARTRNGVALPPTGGSLATYQWPTTKLASGADTTNAITPPSPQIDSAPTPKAVETIAEAMPTRARSPIRRRPLSNAACEPEATVRATARPSQPITWRRDGSPTTCSANTSRMAQTTAPPVMASASVPQNSARLASSTHCVSLRPTASAI